MTAKLTTSLVAAVLGATAASAASASVSPNPIRWGAEPTGFRMGSEQPDGFRWGSVQPSGFRYTHPGAVRYGAGGEAIRWSIRPTFRVVRF